MSKKGTKISLWTVPLKISYTITWLARVQNGHESASGSASHQDFFLDPHPHILMRIRNTGPRTILPRAGKFVKWTNFMEVGSIPVEVMLYNQSETKLSDGQVNSKQCKYLD
jgi:hypothetical protein